MLASSNPVDFRKSIAGWVGLVKTVLAEAPLSGSLFGLVKRRGHSGKLVSWDRTGWCVLAQR
jgi:transposase